MLSFRDPAVAFSLILLVSFSEPAVAVSLILPCFPVPAVPNKCHLGIFLLPVVLCPPSLLSSLQFDEFGMRLKSTPYKVELQGCVKEQLSEKINI